MTDKTKPPVSEVFDQALKNYEQTLRAGLKLQEETGRWWTNLLNQAASAQDLQKRVKAITNEVIPPAQKRMEEYLDLLEKNNRVNVELLKKAVEAGQISTPSAYQAKAVDFCETSLNAFKANTDAIAQINSKMIDSWISFVKKNAVEFPEPTVGKA